jgi:hypothetical protein
MFRGTHTTASPQKKALLIYIIKMHGTMNIKNCVVVVIIVFGIGGLS